MAETEYVTQVVETPEHRIVDAFPLDDQATGWIKLTGLIHPEIRFVGFQDQMPAVFIEHGRTSGGDVANAPMNVLLRAYRGGDPVPRVMTEYVGSCQHANEVVWHVYASIERDLGD